MKPWERWTFGLLALLVSVTGGAYFWMKCSHSSAMSPGRSLSGGSMMGKTFSR